MNLQISKVVFSSVLFIYCNIKIAESQLRITGGKTLSHASFKNYMVYLIKAVESERVYDTWICGGVIVTEFYILTSAACVEDVKHMYAVQGLIKYIPTVDIDTDPCFATTKKKVVEYCVPHAYEFNFAEPGKWSKIDIALAKVEAAYVMNQNWQNPSCKIPLKPPGLIPINFYPQYQEPGTDVFVLGWGHNESFRMESDQTDYNQPYVQYAASQIIDKQKCKTAYAKSNYKDSLTTIIDNYMVCSDGEGSFDADGNLTVFDNPSLDGCLSHTGRVRAECLRALARMGKPTSSDNTRRNGICQNDHGGPLVTWVGSQEYVVGVASVFLIRGRSLKCTGPFLYASSYCNSGFLRCVLKHEKEYELMFQDKPSPKRHLRRKKTTVFPKNTTHPRQGVRKVTQPKFEITTPLMLSLPPMPPMPPPPSEKGSSEDDDEILRYLNFLRGGPELEVYCNQPARKRGFDIVKSKISWRNHKDGPAANEREEDLLKVNEQRPLSYKKTVLT